MAAGVNASRRNAYTTPRLRNALCRHIRWTRGQLGKPPEILSDCREGELELSTPWPAQAQPAETQDAFEMSEQHFHFLAVAPGLRIGLGCGKGAGNAARRLDEGWVVCT